MKSLSAGLASASLLIISATAGAQAPGADGFNELEEIIVTARRKEESVQDVPISMTVFSQEQLTSNNIVSANELAKYTPSLQTNSRYGSESASFSIRGFVQENQTSPSVAVYFADVTAPRSQGGTQAGNGAGPGSFFDLQNVQVLKGPQGTLFGRNTTGGAVLLVPVKPGREFGGYIEGSAGNYGMLREQGALNLPVSDAFRIRLSVDHQDRDGYLNNVSGIGPKDFGDVGYTAARLSLVAEITPDLENYTIASFSRSSTNGFYPKIVNNDNGTCLTTRDCRDPFPQLRAAQRAATAGDYWDIANGLPQAHQTIKQWQVINTTTFQASDTITLKNIASYSQFQQSQAANIYGENGFQDGRALGFVAVNILPEPGKHNVSQQTFTEEVQVQGRIADDFFTYQAGAYFEKSTPLDGFQGSYSVNNLACPDPLTLQCQNVTTEPNPPIPPSTTAGFIQNSRTQYKFTDTGLYAQGTLKFTDQLSLTTGIRYTTDKTEGLGQVIKISFPTANTPTYGCSQPSIAVQGGTAAQVQADPSLCNFRRTEKSSKPTWLVDLDYKPMDNLLAYVKYARGYRQGGVNVSSYGLETWKPEQVDLYEVGTKLNWRSVVPGAFNVAVFYNKFTDQQIAINTLPCNLNPAAANCVGFNLANSPSPAQGIGNSGESTIKGVEADLTISPFEGLNLSLAYAYLDTELTAINVPAPAVGFASFVPNAILGGPLQNTPKNKGAATLSYALPLPESIGRIIPAVTYTQQGTTFGNNSSLTLKTLPEQKNLNVNLDWKQIMGSAIDVGLFATNVTNEKYFVFATGASFGWDAVVLNEPRIWGARVKYSFGSK
jgi:iron complex outermembrane receptor protein